MALKAGRVGTQSQGQTYICGAITQEERRALRSDRRVTVAPPAQCVRRPAILAEMAWERLRRGSQSDIAGLVPIYLAAPAGSAS